MGKKALFTIMAFMAVAMGISACGKNPDSSIVKNKDFDKMIEKAQDSEAGNKEVKDIAPDYDTYKSSFSDESLKVTVKADAKVDVPDVDKMSIVRVKQKDISQDFLNIVIDKVAGNEQLYDGSITEARTRKEIEEEIRIVKESMKDESEGRREEFKVRLEKLQAEYENSTADIDWDKYVSDGQLHSVEEMLQRMDNSFYKWEKSLNPDGDVFYAVNKGDNGEFISLYAQNNEDSGNCLRFGKSRHGHLWNMQVYTPFESIPNIEEPKDDANVWSAGSSIPQRKNSMLGGNVPEYEDEGVTIPGDEAKKKADEFIRDIGIEDFRLYGSGLYSEVQTFRENLVQDTVKEVVDLGYCTYYLFRYVREVDGIFVTLEGEDKNTAGWENDSFVKKVWPKEYIDIKVNDNGIIEFIYNGPLEKVDTVVDKSNMLPFDEIKDRFEKMAVPVNAQYELDNENIDIVIDRVTLGYAVISEKDSFDTGLLVPVWDFIGTKKVISDGRVQDKNYGTVMTINAIDGTVIDRSLGY